MQGLPIVERCGSIVPGLHHTPCPFTLDNGKNDMEWAYVKYNFRSFRLTPDPTSTHIDPVNNTRNLD